MLFTTEEREFFKLLIDSTVDVEDVSFITEDVIEVDYRSRSDHVRQPAHSSLITAIFITSQARLELYKYLEEYKERVLYFDTGKQQNALDELLAKLYFSIDSIFIIAKEGQKIPSTGDHLGEMSNELAEYGDGAYITKFASVGAKSHFCEIVNDSGEVFTTSKAKGITLTDKAKRFVNFSSVVGLIKNQDTRIEVPQERFLIKDLAVYTQQSSKEFKIVYDKRRLISTDTEPFGY